MLQSELLALSPVQGPGSRLPGQAFPGRRPNVRTVLSRVCPYRGRTWGALVILERTRDYLTPLTCQASRVFSIGSSGWLVEDGPAFWSATFTIQGLPINHLFSSRLGVPAES